MRNLILTSLLVFASTWLGGCGSDHVPELQKEGIKVMGVVVDGKSESNDGDMEYSLHVIFTSQEGKKVDYKQKYVDEHAFKSAYKGKKVEIIYLKKDPEIFEIISGDMVYAFYPESSKISIEDLMALMNQNITKPEDAARILSNIEYGWRKYEPRPNDTKEDAEVNNQVLENVETGSQIRFLPNGEMGYKSVTRLVESSQENSDESRLKKYIQKEISEPMKAVMPQLFAEEKNYYVYQNFYILHRMVQNDSQNAGSEDPTKMSSLFWLVKTKVEPAPQKESAKK
ncbi:MAG: hypothetical protein EAZ95_18330 [Bacteroidetes bacterium]|nr:MAG: hypothetical protein EAZ95_18330 [Bacteroidota bacterium]